MIRTQIQLPDPLYHDLKRIAREHDWTLAEVLRRAGENFASRFPNRDSKDDWSFPKPLDLGGDFRVLPEHACSEADAIAERQS